MKTNVFNLVKTTFRKSSDFLGKNADLIIGWTEALCGLLDILDRFTQALGWNLDVWTFAINCLVRTICEGCRWAYFKRN